MAGSVSTGRGRRVVRIAGVLVLVSALGACAGSNDAGPNPGATTDPATELTDPTDQEVATPTPEPVGVEVSRFALDVGDCFNEYRLASANAGLVELTTAVHCAGPHRAEVYHQTIHDAAAGEPFPGTDEIERWATRECYEAFEGFVGIPYEASRLHIGTIVPTPENWVLGPYRGLTCYVYDPAGDLEGTMRQSRS